jgi:hypothetical protein
MLQCESGTAAAIQCALVEHRTLERATYGRSSRPVVDTPKEETRPRRLVANSSALEAAARVALAVVISLEDPGRSWPRQPAGTLAPNGGRDCKCAGSGGAGRCIPYVPFRPKHYARHILNCCSIEQQVLGTDCCMLVGIGALLSLRLSSLLVGQRHQGRNVRRAWQLVVLFPFPTKTIMCVAYLQKCRLMQPPASCI